VGDFLGYSLIVAALAFAGAALVSEARSREGWVLLAVGPALLLFIALVEAFAWPTYALWVEEDRWIEWGTAAVFFAGLIGFGLKARAATDLVTRLVFVGLALFCFLVAGEEISWAQRLLFLQPPDAFLVENYQQELNVHNLITRRDVGGVKLDTKSLVAIIAVIYAASAAVAAWVKRPAFVDKLRPTAPLLALAPTLLLVGALEALYPWDKTGEVAEWLLGIGFALASLPREANKPPALKMTAGVLGVAVVGGWVLSAVTGVALTQLGHDKVPLAMEELTLLAGDLQDPQVVRRSRKRYASVHKRLFTAAKQGRVKVPVDGRYLGGEPSPATKAKSGTRDRRHYYLDPWGNAYWLLYLRNREALYLYSFGPNGRRDGDLERSEQDLGDDVFVRVDYPNERR
jgi:hypothetical protein